MCSLSGLIDNLVARRWGLSLWLRGVEALCESCEICGEEVDLFTCFKVPVVRGMGIGAGKANVKRQFLFNNGMHGTLNDSYLPAAVLSVVSSSVVPCEKGALQRERRLKL